MVKHTGKKPFKCEVCSIRFTQKSNMKHHMKRSHSYGKQLTHKTSVGAASCLCSWGDQTLELPSSCWVVCLRRSIYGSIRVEEHFMKNVAMIVTHKALTVSYSTYNRCCKTPCQRLLKGSVGITTPMQNFYIQIFDLCC